ncbi:MAG: hypothetical protein AYL32_012440 [Candidatus Bathyarchaeota archaeon B26-2]|nr:MAG: hypothetical protein AYL32_012440 [Candidatus Bathyarchaeota archaeon B26-2]
MVRKKFLACWFLILLALALTFYYALSPELTAKDLIFTPFGEGGTLMLRGKSIVDYYTLIADRVWSSYNNLLASKPYDPGLFAWGIHYEIRSYCEMYRLTEDRLWIERAVARCDYLYSVRDVNGDGIPSWGNYNATYGNSRYEREGWREFGVWDGVLTTALIETVQVILENQNLRANQTLREKADRYLETVKTVIDRYHNAWTDISEGMGYYWDSPEEDVTGPIVNRFAALGITEIKLYEVLGDPKYLVKPAAMAAFFKMNLQLRDGAYIWTYAVPPSRYTGSIEDISHGAIDLEFAILAYRHNLAFNKTDMQRFVATYKNFIWKGFNRKPHVATRVDGTVTSDYSGASRNWVLLSAFDPAIWTFQWIVFNDLEPSYSGAFLQAISQLITYYPGEEAVEVMLQEAEKAVEGAPPFYPFKYFAERSLDGARSLYEAGDLAGAFREARRCMVMVENAGKAMAAIIFLAVLAAILAVVQLLTGRRSGVYIT